MSAAVAKVPSPVSDKKLEKKPIKFSNLLLGAGLNMFEVTTLGQPLEVVKTTMAAHRGDGFGSALARIWNRGGVLGCTFPINPIILSFSLSLSSPPPPTSPLPLGSLARERERLRVCARARVCVCV